MLLAERMHWTLEYTENMPAEDFFRVWHVIFDGLDKARHDEEFRAAERAKRRH